MATVNVRDRNKNKAGAKANWEYSFEVARIGGKRKKFSKTGFKTKKEAYEAGLKAINEYNNTGKTFTPSEISISDYLDFWLENYAVPNLADSTVKAYSNIIKNHIKPNIGYYRLKDADTTLLQNMIDKINFKKGFTKAFIKNILKVLKGAFHYAKVTAKFIQIDPAFDVSMPKHCRTKENVNFISKENVIKILDRFKTSPQHYYALLIGYYTGLRVSEVYGLTWDCIDFEKKTLTVNKIAKEIDIDLSGMRHGGFKRRANNKWYLGDCKTESSERTIMINDTLLNALKDYKQMQENNKKKYGELYTDNYLEEVKTKSGRIVYKIIPFDSTTKLVIPYPKTDLVIVRENGSFQGTIGMKYVSKVINNEMNIPFRFHAFRHTHGIILYENNAPIKDIQERLGHSSIKTTMDIYVDGTEKIKEKSVKIFDEFGDLNYDTKPRNERLYDLWKSLVNRCKTNESYVEKGITLCDDWEKSFDNFKDWAFSSGYDDLLYLNRKDKEQGYDKNNCEWVTKHEIKNTKKSILVS